MGAKTNLNICFRKNMFGLIISMAFLVYVSWDYVNEGVHIFSRFRFRSTRIYNVITQEPVVYVGKNILQGKMSSMETDIRSKSIFSTKHVDSRTSIMPVSIMNVTQSGETIFYEKCMHIPEPPKGMEWYEERFIYDPPLIDLSTIVSLSHSRVWVVGKEFDLGSTIRLRISLYDENKIKRKGGDLVRVWMREQSLNAAAIAKVTDKLNGDYEAEITALWVGRPEIRVAVIEPREVMAIKFRRRYICPQILTNMGVFGRTSTQTEKTPCSYYPQIPGYSDVCDLTEENYGQPWFCGKPRSTDLPCNEWTFISERFFGETFDKALHTTLENKILTRGYRSTIIPAKITVEIKSDKNQKIMPSSVAKCNTLGRRHTWNQTAPSGYLYKNRWITQTCTGRGRDQKLTDCVKNMKIILIGDSTVRQLFESLSQMTQCQWKPTPKKKHTTYYCENTALNYSIEYFIHGLPFCTDNTYHAYFRSIKANLNLIQRSISTPDSNVIVLIHMFTHFLNYHSHVLYENMNVLKSDIAEFLEKVPHARVIIKGPHAYMENPLQLPTCYMEAYIEYLNHIFKGMSDKIMYLDAAEITIATEEKALHPKENTIREMIYKVFDFVCLY